MRVDTGRTMLNRAQSKFTTMTEYMIFLQKHFLHWLEALSLLGCLADTLQHIGILQSLLAPNGSTYLTAFLEDSRRFILTNRYICDLAPMQLYSSAIIFAPQNSIIKKVYSEVPGWIQQCPITPVTWSSELQTLGSHTDWVWAVAFSPDGSVLASASDDETIRLWDTKTGQEVQKLEGHTTGSVNAVAFSPNGSVLASASDDGTVRLWDTRTGQQLNVLKDHQHISELSFSSNGQSLQTNRRTIHIGSTPSVSGACEGKTSNDPVLTDDWIECGGQKVLWLPHEYRSSVSAIYGNTLAIGRASGAVSFFQIQPP